MHRGKTRCILLIVFANTENLNTRYNVSFILGALVIWPLLHVIVVSVYMVQVIFLRYARWNSFSLLDVIREVFWADVGVCE